MKTITRLLKPSSNTFRLQYASNLFVDSINHPFQTLLEPAANTLALLGNIGRPSHNHTEYFLNYCAEKWDKVLWILGPYELTNKGGRDKMHYENADECLELARKFDDKVYVMNHNEYSVPSKNVNILGATLWTNNEEYIANQPEFTSIYKMKDVPLTPKDYQDWHKEDYDFLYMRGSYYKSTEPSATCIILTHHLPYAYLFNRGLSEDAYKRIYLDVNTCQEKINPYIRAWLSGATGSCSSGYFGRTPGQQTFCSVNSCFQSPSLPIPNPGYYNKMILEISSDGPSQKKDEGLPSSERLPPLVSGIFKSKLSSA